VTAAAHSSPYGCAGTTSAQFDESPAHHDFVDTDPFVDTPLVGEQCMDIRHLWLARDPTHFHVGVQGPAELWERGDLFVATDTDNATGVAQAGRFTGSDNTVHDFGTIAEYCGMTNFGAEYPIPTGRGGWGDVKTLYRRASPQIPIPGEPL
jgi:hypothetical protein